MAAVDLHLHSTASDGELHPAEVVVRASEAGLEAIALTDHDTLDGLSDATTSGAAVGVRVVPGCEFSVAASWGEMHLLGYFLPTAENELGAFLADQRAKRTARAKKIVERINRAGVELTVAEVLEQARGAAVGRPHVARALVARQTVPDIGAAFDRYIGWGRPAFVAKQLPSVADVTVLVRSAGGVTSAAHLGQRASRSVLQELRAGGVDGVEVVHPSHDVSVTKRIRRLVREARMLPTGGSDWHGDGEASPSRAQLGSLDVPMAWLEALEALHQERVSGSEVAQ